MANEVYTRALGGVQRLVSAKAASRALENALKAKGKTPDTVDAEVMSRILLGPILNEFETILPREGLKRQLRSLAANLRKNFPKVDAPSPAPEPTAESVVDVVENSETLVSAEDVREEDKDEEDASSSLPEQETDPGFVYQTKALSEVPESLDLIFSVTSSSVKMPQPPEHKKREPEPVRNAPSAVLGPDVLEIPEEPFELPEEFLAHAREADTQTRLELTAPVHASEPLSQKQLEAAVLRFAQLEQVKFVAALRSNGKVAAKRGSGIDVDSLAQLGLIGLKLLRRSGPLQTYYLAHTQGQLFLLPIGDDTLTLVGTPELNVGAVFNTFATLKEER